MLGRTGKADSLAEREEFGARPESSSENHRPYRGGPRVRIPLPREGSRLRAAGGIRSEDAVHRNNRAPRRERHDHGGSRVGRRGDRASAAWHLESWLTATVWIGYDPRSSLRMWDRAWKSQSWKSSRGC